MGAKIQGTEAAMKSANRKLCLRWLPVLLLPCARLERLKEGSSEC
jgi:hypothetical protein